jgi:hypothetical protein
MIIMKNLDKIFWTLIILTFWLPFVFQNSEVRMKGTEHEYINTIPNLSLMIIPYALISIWIISKIWEKNK